MYYVDHAPEDPDAVPGYGSPQADFVFVGAAPGVERGRTPNLPMGPKSIGLIENLMSRLGSDSWYVTNTVKAPQNLNNKVRKNTVRKWYPVLLDELRAVKPRRILALGLEAAETLCPGFQNMQEDHGTFFWNPELECYVIPTQPFHKVSRNRKQRNQQFRDIQRMLTLPDPRPAKVIKIKLDKPVPGGYFADIHRGKRVWFDIETTGLEFTDDITRIGWSWHPSKSIVYQLDDPSQRELWHLRDEFNRLGVTIIGHNLQFDLARVEWKSKKPWHFPIEDTLLRAHVMGERGVEDKTGVLNLKHLTTLHTDRPGPHAYGTHSSTGNALDLYLAEDVLSTRDLWKYQQDKLINLPRGFPYILNILSRLLPYMVSMQLRGVFLDHSQLQSLEREATARLRKVERELLAYGDINWNSTEQAVPVFLEAGVKLTERTDTGAFTLKESALLKVKDQHPLASKLLEYRECKKNMDFVDQYLKAVTGDDPYLRPRLMMTGTETGRLSCRNPNLQQVPRIGPIKKIFRSRHPGGKMGLVDLSQAELRVVALLSGDELLLEALLADDVHRAIASMIFEMAAEYITSAQRKKSKGVTFGLLYGGGEEGLAHRVGVPVREVREVIDKIFSTFKKLAKWIDDQHALAASSGGSTTYFGRFRDLSEVRETEGVNSVNRKASNTPVQSLASDTDLILMYVCNMLLEGLGYHTRTVLAVHDSILFDIYPGEERQVAEVVLEAFKSLNETPLAEIPLWGKLPMAGEFIVGDSWAHVESTNENFEPDLIYPVTSRESDELISDWDAEGLALDALEEKLNEA